ncbi:MAG: ParB/RepB/Spo0J family partition protein [Patescibacteria group bacterium]
MNSPLGKGLASLIPNREDSDQNNERQHIIDAASLSQTGDKPLPDPVDYSAPRRGDAVFWLDIEKIKPNPYQPRREFNESALRDLSNSIREHGVLQPIIVTKNELEAPTGIEVSYELIAGERRWRAATLAGLSQIPAIIRRGMPDGRIKLELALIENVQREDLNPIERARAFKQLVDEFKLVQRDIAVKIGKSRESVTNTLRLLALPEEIQNALQTGLISEGHARAILMANDNADGQFKLYRAILADGLTVRASENKARQLVGRIVPRKNSAAIPQDPELRVAQEQLQERLGTKVIMLRQGKRGKIVVEFYSDEELRLLLRKLSIA